MYTTTNETGVLNNYPTEPAMYYAQYPSPEQQSRYAQLAGLAAIFVSGLLFTAIAISSVG